MTQLRASALEIEPFELVHFLLKESDQYKSSPIDPHELLRFLGLRFYQLDLDGAIPRDYRGDVERPRALLSFSDKLVVVHSELNQRRTRFSILHEISHYVLPNHEHHFYFCNDKDLGRFALLEIEKEANAFAADLMFKGDLFTIDANNLPIGASSLKTLSEQYDASFESSGRRFAEKSLRACMFIVFEVSQGQTAAHPTIEVKYSIPSPTFAANHFPKLKGSIDTEELAELLRPGRDIADSIELEIPVTIRGDVRKFRLEIFSNSYNVLGLMTPVE